MSYETLARRTDEEVRAASLYIHALRILPRPPATEPARRRLIAVGSRSGCIARSIDALELRSAGGSLRGE
jgi:DNA-binding SARP family transcriptional activator